MFSRAANRLRLLQTHLSQGAARAASTDSTSWAQQWSDATAVIHSDVSHEESGEQLRKLIGTGLLKFTDLRDDPEKFFHAHRVLARHAVDHGPGFWIRFTVQYNLFAGTIVGVGGDEQLEQLAQYQHDEQLGCFGLTEKLAGVQSGLVVNTTCNWDEEKQKFILHTPNDGAKKNWISQGYVSDKAVVLANLHADGKWRGPHAFVMDFRSNGELCKGVSLEDMGTKTTGNDLDNAAISFEHVELPREALLNRYADVIDNKYVMTSKIPPFAMIGQRLYTGRVAVAQAALSYTRQLFKVTKEYSDNKQIVTPGGGTSPLSSIPQLRAIYTEADEASTELETFVGECERQLSENLRSSTLPDPKLVHAIAVAKVRAVETSIALCFKLKQEVGSFALMEDSGFKHMDFLQCCKFAEGDSRILMQKMARDRFRQFTKAPSGAAGAAGEDDDDEVRICNELVEAMASELELSGDKHKAWDDQYELVYELAEATMDRAQAAYRV